MAKKYRNNTDETAAAPIPPGGRAIVYDPEEDEKRKEFLKKYESKFGGGKMFMKFYTSIQPYLMRTLSPEEYGFLSMISYYACYVDNILRAGGKRNQKLLNKKDLSELTGISYRKCCELMDALIELRIIDEIRAVDKSGREKNCFVLNPYIASHGSNYLREITDRFKGSEWFVLWSNNSEEVDMYE